MRISDIDLQCEDIMWFATDCKGNIFECTSAGCGNVPEYICRSREETDALLEYFMEKVPIITTSRLLIPSKNNDLVNDAKKLATKGLYCIAIPDKALNISELPDDIQKMLSDHIYNGNVSEEHSITVDHAY